MFPEMLKNIPPALLNEVTNLVHNSDDQFNTRVFSGESGGGIVKVEVSSKGKLLKVDIDSKYFKEETKALIEDLIVAAEDRAINFMRAEYSKLTNNLMAKVKELCGDYGLLASSKIEDIEGPDFN